MLNSGAKIHTFCDMEKIFFATCKKVRIFAVDFIRKSRSVIPSSCGWKCRNLPKTCKIGVTVYAY